MVVDEAMKKRIWRVCGEWVAIVVGSLLIALVLKATVVQPNLGQEDLRIRTHIRDPGFPRAPIVAAPNEGNQDARQIYLKKNDFGGTG